MAARAIEIRKLTPHIGAEIHGVDLASLDEPTYRQVRDALVEHGVIFFRDQQITP
jgi:taurine dioxygenase